MTDTLMPGATGVLVLADGTILQGIGVGAVGDAVGEVCFNTAMTGYQEILTDPSYMAQIVTFTFPHVGNVGVNLEDIEEFGPGRRDRSPRGHLPRPAHRPGQLALSVRSCRLDEEARPDRPGRGRHPRPDPDRPRQGHAARRDRPCPGRQVRPGSAEAQGAGLEGHRRPSTWPRTPPACSPFVFEEGLWSWPAGYAKLKTPEGRTKPYEVVVVDYGIKRNILRALTSVGVRATVVPATTTADEILARKPDGVLLSNGPGDPAATGEYTVPEIKKLVESGTPLFGICLGHQMLALALGAQTTKMDQGHHGANHPVKDLTTGKVEIVSMNHGFTVDRDTLPETVAETHVSLFDGTNAGIALKNRPVFSVQHHPEASPGPTDSLYLFERFAEMMEKA